MNAERARWYESEARQRLCPLAAGRNADGSITRAQCVASECALWHSVIDNAGGERGGYGYCTIPDIVSEDGSRAVAEPVMLRKQAGG